MATKTELEAENEKLRGILRTLDLSPDLKVEAGLLPEKASGKAFVELTVSMEVPLETFNGWWGDAELWTVDPTIEDSVRVEESVLAALDLVDIPGAVITYVSMDSVHS